MHDKKIKEQLCAITWRTSMHEIELQEKLSEYNPAVERWKQLHKTDKRRAAGLSLSLLGLIMSLGVLVLANAH